MREHHFFKVRPRILSAWHSNHIPDLSSLPHFWFGSGEGSQDFFSSIVMPSRGAWKTLCTQFTYLYQLRQIIIRSDVPIVFDTRPQSSQPHVLHFMISRAWPDWLNWTKVVSNPLSAEWNQNKWPFWPLEIKTHFSLWILHLVWKEIQSQR